MKIDTPTQPVGTAAESVEQPSKAPAKRKASDPTQKVAKAVVSISQKAKSRRPINTEEVIHAAAPGKKLPSIKINPSTQPVGSAPESADQPSKAPAKRKASVPTQKVAKAVVSVPQKAKPRRPINAEAVIVATPAKKRAVKAVVSDSKSAKLTPQRQLKEKMVRDSFTFPEVEHKRLVELKKRVIALGIEVKKGELIRAGLDLLAALDNQKLLKAVAGVEKLKTGRPKK